MMKNIKHLAFKLANIIKGFDDDIFRRFLFLPITIVIVASLVLGVNFAKKHFAISSEETQEVTLAKMLDEKEDGKILTREKVSKMSESDKKLDINLASEKDFQRLPGIGSTKAEAIVNERNKMGKFFTIDDIKCVDGIGAGLFEKIRNFITVDED